MTTRDKQLKEAMDLLQESREMVQWWAKELGVLELKTGASIMRKHGAKIHRFQKRWSKSQRQPQ